MYVIMIKWRIIKLLKTISFCAISLEINHCNVHCFTPVVHVFKWSPDLTRATPSKSPAECTKYIYLLSHKPNVIILMKFPSLAAPEVVKMTSSAVSNENFIKIITFRFHQTSSPNPGCDIFRGGPSLSWKSRDRLQNSTKRHWWQSQKKSLVSTMSWRSQRTLHPGTILLIYGDIAQVYIYTYLIILWHYVRMRKYGQIWKTAFSMISN